MGYLMGYGLMEILPEVERLFQIAMAWMVEANEEERKEK